MTAESDASDDDQRTELERTGDGRFVTLATAGTVAYSLVVPLSRLDSIAGFPSNAGNVKYAVIALACYLPIQVWLVVSAARNERGSAQVLGLAAMGAVIFAAMPLVGVGWVGILYVLAALTLVTLRPPWSLLLFGALVVAPTPLTLIFGQPEWALFFTQGMLLNALPLAAAIWLIRISRQLQAAQLALAEQSIVSERLRIDAELRAEIGTQLEAVISRGSLALALSSEDPSAASGEVRTLVDAARRTHAKARALITQYRAVSLRSELDSAVALLSAAGIQTRLKLPASQLEQPLSDTDRLEFRQRIARLLESPVPPSVTIVVVQTNGTRGVELQIGQRVHGHKSL